MGGCASGGKKADDVVDFENSPKAKGSLDYDLFKFMLAQCDAHMRSIRDTQRALDLCNPWLILVFETELMFIDDR